MQSASCHGILQSCFWHKHHTEQKSEPGNEFFVDPPKYEHETQHVEMARHLCILCPEDVLTFVYR